MRNKIPSQVTVNLKTSLLPPLYRKTHRLGRYSRCHRCSLESRVANNLANLALLLKRPLPLPGVRKRGIDIRIPGRHNGLTGLVNHLAPIILFLNQSPDHNLHRGERARVHGFLLSRALGEGGLDGELGGLVAELDADFGARARCGDLPECGIADDLADFGGFFAADGPFAFAAVGEDGVGVVAALDDGGFAGLVEDLAPGGLVGYVFADMEFDEGEGPVGGGVLGCPWGSGEVLLGGCGIGAAECHLEFVVVWRSYPGGCECGGSGQSGEEDGGVYVRYGGDRAGGICGSSCFGIGIRKLYGS